jgi:hypothetical protein
LGALLLFALPLRCATEVNAEEDMFVFDKSARKRRVSVDACDNKTRETREMAPKSFENIFLASQK